MKETCRELGREKLDFYTKGLSSLAALLLFTCKIDSRFCGKGDCNNRVLPFLHFYATWIAN